MSVVGNTGRTVENKASLFSADVKIPDFLGVGGALRIDIAPTTLAVGALLAIGALYFLSRR